VSAYVFHTTPRSRVGIVGNRTNSDDVSAAEEEEWGVVVPLRRHRSEPGSFALGPISPELVLVDPELARAARALLPDLPRAVPARTDSTADAVKQSVFVERLRSGIEPVVKDAPPTRRRGGLLTGVVCVGAAALLAFFVRQESQPEPRQAAVADPPATVPATTRNATSPGATTSAPEPEPTTPGPTTPVQTAPQATAPSTGPAPVTPAEAAPGQTFVWVADPGASAYEFQLFRGAERVFRARVEEPRLDLPGRWRHAGTAQALTPGSYRWYVWPVSAETKRQAAVAIVQARLEIKGQPQ
jgi:hypothetical protein